MADEKTTLVRLGDTDLTVAEDAVDVRGRRVVDRDGDDIGEVDDLVIDDDERRVRFLEVASGGFLGIGEKDVAVQLSQITIRQEEGDPDDLTFVLNATREELENAPPFQTQQDQQADQAAQDAATGAGTAAGTGAPADRDANPLHGSARFG